MENTIKNDKVLGKVGIVGLGLMGGSMGLALKKTRQFKRVLGFDNNPLHSQQALNLGLVDECVSVEEILCCEVIFLCVPIEGIIDFLVSLKSVKLPKNSTIIDVGGAKVEILKAIPKHLRAHFVGAHPMCGTEHFGPSAAFDSLYENAIVIFTDSEESGAYQVEVAKDLFISIGMKILKMSAKEHDKHIALISHMPHILSYALANTTLARENPQMILALIGGGFRSMSRISKSSPKMWKDIFKYNKHNVLNAMKYFEIQFDKARALIENDDWEGLEAFMAEANSLQKFL